MVRSSSCWRYGAVAVMLLVGGLGVASPSLTNAAQLQPTDAQAPDFEGLMAEADQQRAQGEDAAAARSYAAAYRALPEADRAGPLGELAVDNALTSYGRAYEARPEDLVLLEESVALIEEHIATSTKAHDAGEAQEVPPRFEEERVRLTAQLEAAREATSPPEEDAEPEPLELEPVEPGPVDPEPVEPEANRRADVAILSSGAVVLAGGVALIAGGGWSFGEIDRQRQARLNALDQALDDGLTTTPLTPEDYRAELAEWSGQRRGVATGLVVAGSVLAAAGIGLAAWGAVRMRRSGRATKRRASLWVPLVSQERVGMSMTVEF